ncbi:unnamed protein product [Linum trigynum]
MASSVVDLVTAAPRKPDLQQRPSRREMKSDDGSLKSGDEVSIMEVRECGLTLHLLSVLMAGVGFDWQVAKITGEEWKNLTEKKKAPYEEMAKKNKEKYLIKMEAYKLKKDEEGLVHGDNFGGKRMRKLTQRRAVDYTSTAVRY